MSAPDRWRHLNPFGPPLGRELRTLSRRPAVFAARTFLVLAVGGGLVLHLAVAPATDAGPQGLDELTGLTFHMLTWFPWLLLTLLTPALVGGLVARERERGTLTLPLTTDLSAAEIVGGKLLSRIAVAAAVVLATVPLAALVGLFGGVDLGRILAAAAVTLASTAALAAVGTWLSVRSRRTWAAVLQCYMLVLVLWIVLPLAAPSVPWGSMAGPVLTLAGLTPSATLTYLTGGPVLQPLLPAVGGLAAYVAVPIAGHLLVASVAAVAAVRALRRPLPHSRHRPEPAPTTPAWAAGPWRRLLDLNPLLSRGVTGQASDPAGTVRRLQWLWTATLAVTAVAAASSRPLTAGGVLTLAAWLQFGTHVFAAVLAATAVAGRRGRGGLDVLLTTRLTDGQFVTGAAAAAVAVLRPLLLCVLSVTTAATAFGLLDVPFALSYLVLASALLLHVVGAAVLVSVVAVDAATAVVASLLVVAAGWTGWLWDGRGPAVTLVGVAALLVLPAVAATPAAPSGTRGRTARRAGGLLLAAVPVGLCAFVALRMTITAAPPFGTAGLTLLTTLLAPFFFAGCAGLLLGPSLLLGGRHAPTVAALATGLLLPFAWVGVLYLAVGLPLMAWTGKLVPMSPDMGQAMGLHAWTAGAVATVGSSNPGTFGSLGTHPPLGWLPGGRYRPFVLHASPAWGWLAALLHGASGLVLLATARRAFAVRRTEDDP